MSTIEVFSILKDWCERKTTLEVLSLSATNWPFRMMAQIVVCEADSSKVEVLESESSERTHSLDLAWAEMKWALPEDNPAPFEGTSPAEFKGFLFLKLMDGKHIVMVERQARLNYAGE